MVRNKKIILKILFFIIIVSTQPPIQRVRGAKLPAREAECSASSGAEITYVCEVIPSLPHPSSLRGA
jgi:hypothetical protein